MQRSRLVLSKLFQLNFFNPKANVSKFAYKNAKKEFLQYQ
jgi:hypothetical protein